MTDLRWTGERLVTSLNSVHGVIEHLHRYALAVELCENKVVLDIASGEGYGSFLLSKKAKKVIGVDLDQETINHAKQKYSSSDNLDFLVGSTSKIPLPDNSVDVVVSFETLEHYVEHDQMMLEILRVLTPNGCLFISSPEKSIYKLRDPNNPYHIKELTFNEFETLIKRFFKNSKFYSQRFVAGSLVHPLEENCKSHFKIYDGTYSEVYEGINEGDFYNKPFFNLAICSNDESQVNIPTQYSLFNGANVVEKQVKDLKSMNNRLINSRSYKFGSWFAKKLSFLRK